MNKETGKPCAIYDLSGVRDNRDRGVGSGGLPMTISLTPRMACRGSPPSDPEADMTPTPNPKSASAKPGSGPHGSSSGGCLLAALQSLAS